MSTFNFFKKIIGFLCLASMLLYITGCAATNYKLLTKDKFRPKTSGEDVELFLGKIDKAYTAIAIVQSKSYDNKYESTKAKQLEEIKETARKLGADAVHNIHLLDDKVQGYVTDYQVPFESWKQGKYTLYFLR